MINFKQYISKEVLNVNSHFLGLKLIKIYFFGSASKRSILIYRIGEALYNANYKKIAKLFFLKLEKNYNIFISPNAKIGIGLKVPHPSGIIIGDKARIGNNVTIFQQVTIGGARIGDAKNQLYPTIGNDCILFAGAKLLGKVKIGESCIIGANAVVIKDIPDYCTAVGVPAREIDI